jgi:hypothetical protein
MYVLVYIVQVGIIDGKILKCRYSFINEITALKQFELV